MRGKDEGLHKHTDKDLLSGPAYLFIYSRTRRTCRPRRSIGKFVVAEKTRDWILASSSSLLGGTYQKL